MGRYLLQRSFYLVLVLVAVSLLAFGMVHLIPGDPARVLAGDQAREEDVERIRTSLGLDRPLHVQYVEFLGRAARGDFGQSIRSGRPVVEYLQRRVPASAQLATASILLALAIGIPAGVLAATRRSSYWDLTIMLLTSLGVSTPPFWLGLMLLRLFAVELPWLPVSGWGTPAHLVLPAFTLGLFNMAVIARMTRSTMLEVLRDDFVRTARAKGLPDRLILYRHALKNALIPVVAVVGLQFGYLLGASVVTETVFVWPGIGSLLAESILFRDYPLVQAIVLLLAVVFAVVNLAVDLFYGWLDPRVRYG